MNKRKIGNVYEEKVCTFLKQRGYIILNQNYYCRFGEIDIIAQKDEYICFVEVKYRKNTLCGMPEDAVTISKMKKICKTAQFYIFSHKQYYDYQMRFDVVSVLDNGIKIYENAFDYIQ